MLHTLRHTHQVKIKGKTRKQLLRCYHRIDKIGRHKQIVLDMVGTKVKKIIHWKTGISAFNLV